MSDTQIADQTAPVDGDTFELVYDGPAVAAGTMSAREAAEVISGISRAFSIVANEYDVGEEYDLRLRDVDHASFHLILEAVAFAKANPGAAATIVAAAGVGLQAINMTASGAYKVITDIAKLIYAKKQLQGKRVATVDTKFTDGEVELYTVEEVVILTKEQYELLLSQRIDRQLSQIVSPLQPDQINEFEMRRRGSGLVSVVASQRDYFDYYEVVEDRTRESTEIVGTLNSLTKTSLRGTFYTADGIHVPYRYTGGDISTLLRGFASREPIRVRGKVKYGGDGVPTSIEVHDLEFLQRSFIE